MIKGKTYEGTVSPWTPKHVSPNDFTNDVPFPSLASNVQEIAAPVDSDGPYISWAIKRERKVFAIPRARVKSYPAWR